MRTWKQISGFRLFVVVGLSLTTSAALFFADEDFSKKEIFNTLIQAGIVAFSFLQCPELEYAKKTEQKES
jgi:hypothetical protein